MRRRRRRRRRRIKKEKEEEKKERSSERGVCAKEIGNRIGDRIVNFEHKKWVKHTSQRS
jgi:hypothetical protein